MTTWARLATQRGAGTLALAAVALAAVVAVRPPHAPPLYDGLGFPDEPYRWISAPVGGALTPAATPLSLTVDLSSTKPAIATTAEQGPQLAVSLGTGALVVPAGATKVSLSAVPQAAPPPPPSGTVVSNLYRWTATADRPGPVRVAPAAAAVVNLRADIATNQSVVVETWDGTAWHQNATRQVGTDVYAALLTSLEPLALVKLDVGVTPTVTPSPAPSGGSASGAAGGASAASGAAGVGGSVVGGSSPQQVASNGPGAGLWIGVGIVVLMLAFALVLARRRSASAEPSDRDPDQGPDEPPAAATDEKVQP